MKIIRRTALGLLATLLVLFGALLYTHPWFSRVPWVYIGPCSPSYTFRTNTGEPLFCLSQDSHWRWFVVNSVPQ